MKHVRLFTPGPTAVPQEVLETQARPLVHHRTEIFRKTHQDVIENLRYVMATANPVVVLTSSGTGAMEALSFAVSTTRRTTRPIISSRMPTRFAWRCRILQTVKVTLLAKRAPVVGLSVSSVPSVAGSIA